METTTITGRIPVTLEDEINSLAVETGINRNRIINKCLRNARLHLLYNIPDLLERINDLEMKLEKYVEEGLPALKELKEVLSEFKDLNEEDAN